MGNIMFAKELIIYWNQIRRFDVIKSLMLIVLIFCFSPKAMSGDFQINNLAIKSVRAVGQYRDPTFSGTLEIWFTTPLVFPAGSVCTETRRVYLDAKQRHLIAAAYLAFSMGRNVTINVDDTLPLRAGSCEISFLDVQGL
jgi:hypothetical protein